MKTPPVDASKLLARARRHFAVKEYVPARNLCSDILAAQPAHAAAIYLLALCELHAGRYAEVVTALSRLVAHHPDHVHGHVLLSKACLLLGRAYIATGNNAAARDVLLRAADQFETAGAPQRAEQAREYLASEA